MSGRILIESCTAVSLEYRAALSTGEGFEAALPLTYRAEAITGAPTYVPVKRVAHYTRDGRPWLWLRGHTIVLDTARFTDLNRVDAPKLGHGVTVHIGRTLITDLDASMAAEVMLFLLEADIIQCYWHISATLDWFVEDRGLLGFVGHFSGNHVYFTTREHREPLAFKVLVDVNGAIRVRGENAA